MKKFLGLMMAFVLVFSLVACGGNGNSGTTSATGSEPAGGNGGATLDVDEIYIGAIAPLTGGVSVYGNAVNNGALLAVEEINANGGVLGVPIRYEVIDDMGEATEAVSAYERHYNDGAHAILGAVTSGPSVAVAQVASGDGLPLISPSATTEEFTEKGDNVFRTCFIDPYQGQMMANYAQERVGAESVAILYDQDDDYSTGIAEAFRNEANVLGLSVLAYEGYPGGSDDFNSQLTRIREQNPDVVMVPTYYEDAAKILIQADALGIDATFLGADGWDGVEEQLGNNLDVMEGTFYSNQYSTQSENPEVQSFLSEYRDRYGEKEKMFSLLAYDSIYILAAAIERAGSVEPAAIVAAMTETNHKGLTGTTTFDSARNPVRTAYITGLKDGELYVVEEYSFIQ